MKNSALKKLNRKLLAATILAASVCSQTKAVPLPNGTTYVDAGTYTITLTVTDDSGDTDSTSKTITVNPASTLTPTPTPTNIPPVAQDWTFTRTVVCGLPAYETVTWIPRVSDADAGPEPLTCFMEDASSGATVASDCSSGTIDIAWENGPNSSQITYYAFDGQDNSNLASLTIHVYVECPTPRPTPIPTPPIPPTPSPTPEPTPVPTPVPTPIPVPTPLSSLPNGSVLNIDQGVGSFTNKPCTVGSCFGMEVAPDLIIWTDFGPGTDDGFVVGKNQGSGGQELAPSSANNTPGEITDAWNFFANFGTFYTPSGATDNYFGDTSCAGVACVGVTRLGSMNMAWNGSSIPVGNGNGCNSSACSVEELIGDHIFEYTYAGDGQPWGIHYHNVVPDGDPSSFGNVKFQFLARGVADVPSPSPTTQPTSTPTPSPNPTPEPEPTPMPTTCEGLYPQTEVTMIGKGKNLEVEETMTTTFKGHIVSTDEAKGKVTICRGTTVSYKVTSTVGTENCSVKHGVSAQSTGTLTDKGKLVCTNKPDGKDTDKFKIKRSKKKDVAKERRWFR